jgi:hypothetical protein
VRCLIERGFILVTNVSLLIDSVSKKARQMCCYGCRTQDTDRRQRWHYGLIVCCRVGLTPINLKTDCQEAAMLQKFKGNGI